jgi:hypothetical protein
MSIAIKRLLVITAISWALVGCKVEPPPEVSSAGAKPDRMMEELKRYQEQYEAMPGSKILTTSRALVVTRDKANGVTCWSPSDYDRSLSCLPDWMLDRPEKAQ